MPLTTFEWIVVAGAFGLAITVITYFLKRTMSRTDSHDADINEIKGHYVTEEDLKEIKKELKGEVRDLKAELREENKQLTADVTEIKNNYIRRDDFYRTVADLNRGIENIRDLLIKMNGGNGNGEK